AEALIDRFGHVLGDEPAWSRARAHAFALSGRDRAAADLLERVRARRPDDRETLAALARARTRQGDLRGAIALWDDVARLGAAAADPWYESGTLALLAGARDEALRRFAAALERDPGHASTFQAVHAWFGADTAAAADFLRAARAAARPLAAVAAVP